MKTVLKIAVVGILALLISGFDTDYLASREKPTYRKICHTVKSGETLWGDWRKVLRWQQAVW